MGTPERAGSGGVHPGEPGRPRGAHPHHAQIFTPQNPLNTLNTRATLLPMLNRVNNAKLRATAPGIPPARPELCRIIYLSEKKRGTAPLLPDPVPAIAPLVTRMPLGDTVYRRAR